MNKIFRNISASELFATNIGVSGAPIPPNGPGEKYPLLKYIVIGVIVVTTFVMAHEMHKNLMQKITTKNKNDE